MSGTYAEGLSPYRNKGVLGLPEVEDSAEELSRKISQLVNWVRGSSLTVVHTGAGISTSAGIPDFRGPQGVWTLEKKGKKPITNKDFHETHPTTTHMALVHLIREGKVHLVVSQNIDGLHLRSGLPRDRIAELHGNVYTRHCRRCRKQWIRDAPGKTVGLKCTGEPCPGRDGKCRGELHDTILDWKDKLPMADFQMASLLSSQADLNIAMGTSLQIVPAAYFPSSNQDHGGKFVVINLQATKYDEDADLAIHARVDVVMEALVKALEIPPIPGFIKEEVDPTHNAHIEIRREWSWQSSWLKSWRNRIAQRKAALGDRRRKPAEVYKDVTSDPFFFEEGTTGERSSSTEKKDQRHSIANMQKLPRETAERNDGAEEHKAEKEKSLLVVEVLPKSEGSSCVGLRIKEEEGQKCPAHSGEGSPRFTTTCSLGDSRSIGGEKGFQQDSKVDCSDVQCLDVSSTDDIAVLKLNGEDSFVNASVCSMDQKTGTKCDQDVKSDGAVGSRSTQFIGERDVGPDSLAMEKADVKVLATDSSRKRKRELEGEEEMQNKKIHLECLSEND